jgi:hypothetical protein
MAMVQAFSYNFSIIENPLSDGGVFTTIADADFTGVLKAIAGNLCEPTTLNTASASFYSGTVPAPGGTWPADQYAEMTLTTWATAAAFVYFILRQGSAASGTQYIANLSRSGQQWSLFAVVAGTVHTLVSGASQANGQGDVFRLSITGNVLTLSRNGSVVQNFTDTNNFITAGSPGFGLLAPTAITNTQTGLVAFGANQAATPTFLVTGNGLTTTTVTITSASGGTIYYTTDGTIPTHASSSIASGGSVVISRTATLQAIASATDFLDSLVGSFTSPNATLQFAGLLW